MSPAPPAHFSDRLVEAVARRGAPVCIGIDPVFEDLPPALRARHHEPAPAIEEFCAGIIAAASDLVPAVKFQSACFERLGPPGVAILERQCAAAHAAGLITILDAKRGDIGVSARHYAHSARRTHADAITVSGYLGLEAAAPFLEAGLALFVLVRTSNPESAPIQEARLADGRTVAELMADHVAAFGAAPARTGTRGLSDIGAVVGATQRAAGAALRRRTPNAIILVPGYGAQGGAADDIRALLRPDAKTPAEAGVLVSASRSIISAGNALGPAWIDGVRAAAARMRDDLRALHA
ncbi:orotidine-5'-phosphate decarboxylase [soil metagenome]